MVKAESYFLLVIHLDNIGKIQEIIEVFTANGITGCTIFETTGVGHTTFLTSDAPVIATMQRLFGANKQYNKTIFSVIESEDLLNKTMDDIEKVVGDFCKPNKGLMYAFPVAKVRGYRVDLSDESTCKT